MIAERVLKIHQTRPVILANDLVHSYRAEEERLAEEKKAVASGWGAGGSGVESRK